MLAAALLLGMTISTSTPEVLRTEGIAAARPGQVAYLTVYFPEVEMMMLNRTAPNLLSAKTPWGKMQGKPTGVASERKGFEDYYGQVRPVKLKVTVPKSAKPGLYPVQVVANLFVCDIAEKVCVKRDFALRSGIQVLAPGITAPTQPIRLSEDDFKAPKGRFGL